MSTATQDVLDAKQRTWLKSMGAAKTYRPGLHTVQAYLLQELGGDYWKGDVEIE